MLAVEAKPEAPMEALLSDGWVLVKKDYANAMRKTVPLIRLSVTGQFTFNACAADLIDDWVNVLYNPNLNQMAFVVSDQNDLGAYKTVRNGRRAQQRSLRIRHLYTQLGLSGTHVVGQYPVEAYDGVLVIQLPAPILATEDHNEAAS